MENSSETTYPRPERPPPIRNPWGWILLAVLFALVIATALARSFGRKTEGNPEVRAAERGLESAVSMQESLARSSLRRSSPGADPLESLRNVRDSLNGTTAQEAFLRVVIDRETGTKPQASDLKALGSAPQEVKGAALARYERESDENAAYPKNAPTARSTDERFSVRLAAAQAQERSGVARQQARRGLVRTDYLTRIGFFMASLLFGSAAAVLLWLWYGINRLNGAFRPKGLPSLPMTPAEGDQFGLRAALMFGAYLLGSNVLGLLATGLHLPQVVGTGLQLGLLGGMAVYSLRLPADPQVPHLSWRGLALNGDRLGERVAWGIAGSIANIPILLVVSVVSGLLLKHAPAPSHPSTDALMRDPSLGTIALTFVMASICAPIWEETLFRGLLFQGFVGSRVAPVGAALLSSFLFAAIHPQGIAMWPGLAAVALMSCALLAQTRSLVSSIAMHATHNTLTLIVALVAGPIIGAIPASSFSTAIPFFGALP